MKEKTLSDFLSDVLACYEYLGKLDKEKKVETEEEEGQDTFSQVLAAFEKDCDEYLPVTLWARHEDMPENEYLTYKYEVQWEKGVPCVMPQIILVSSTEEEPQFPLDQYLISGGWTIYRDTEEDEEK